MVPTAILHTLVLRNLSDSLHAVVPTLAYLLLLLHPSFVHGHHFNMRRTLTCPKRMRREVWPWIGPVVRQRVPRRHKVLLLPSEVFAAAEHPIVIRLLLVALEEVFVSAGRQLLDRRESPPDDLDVRRDRSGVVFCPRVSATEEVARGVGQLGRVVLRKSRDRELLRGSPIALMEEENEGFPVWVSSIHMIM